MQKTASVIESINTVTDYGKVSIITPVHNAAETIGKAIESVLGQSYANWEMIIVDD